MRMIADQPSTTYDARVTVFAADGEIATAIVDRTVGTDNPLPGQDLVTVHSEVIGPNGRQLFKVDGPIDNIVLPRGSMMTLLLPYKEIPFGSTSLTASAYRVTTNQPVVAYQFNPLCCNYNYTNDASLLLPTSALTNHGSSDDGSGSTRRYTSPYWPRPPDCRINLPSPSAGFVTVSR